MSDRPSRATEPSQQGIGAAHAHPPDAYPEAPTHREPLPEHRRTYVERPIEYEYDRERYIDTVPYERPPPAHGLAVASLVFGVLGLVVLFGIGALLALFCGYVARSRIKQLDWGGDGMAVAGIVLGWIGLFVAIGLAIGAGIYLGEIHV